MSAWVAIIYNVQRLRTEEQNLFHPANMAHPHLINNDSESFQYLGPMKEPYTIDTSALLLLLTSLVLIAAASKAIHIDYSAYVCAKY